MQYNLLPKEKAFKLVEDTRIIAMQPAMDYFDNNYDCNNYYKMLTLLQVDEIERIITLYEIKCGFSISHKKYWLDVRNEIMKL